MRVFKFVAVLACLSAVAVGSVVACEEDSPAMRWVRTIEALDWDGLHALLDENATYHDPTMEFFDRDAVELSGRDAIRDFWKKASEDSGTQNLRYTVNNCFSAGATTVLDLDLSIQIAGEFWNVALERLSLTGTQRTIVRVDGDRIVEVSDLVDYGAAVAEIDRLRESCGAVRAEGGARVGAAAEPTMGQVLECSAAADWRRPDPENVLYLQLDTGRVVMELAPDFAPNHVANVRTLVREGFFDGLAIIRSQENYVVQWGDPAAGQEQARSLGSAAAKLEGEYFRPAEGLDFHRIESRDAYADEVGFVAGFPAGRDGAAGRAWLAHCYASLGAGRDVASDSGNGAQLYVVTGHAPRHLDRNVTLVGRVIQGMEHFTTLPRGTGALGFFEDPADNVPIRSIRLEADVPESERTSLELLRTDTGTFQRFVDARRNRREGWFLDQVGRVGLCNVPLPVREAR